MTRRYKRGKARAPYNFVPLIQKAPDDKGNMTPYTPLEAYSSGEELPHHDRFQAGHLSGYFTVRLTPKTPLYIRGMLNQTDTIENNRRRENKQDNIETADFFTYDGKTPVIPGSSLRGMIRSLVEIITFGKMHFVSDSPKIFFRAVAAPKDDPQGNTYKDIMGNLKPSIHAGSRIGAGYLIRRKGQWFIHPAQSFGNDPFALVPDKPDIVGDVRGIKHLNEGDYRLGQFDVAYHMGRNNKASHVYTPKNSDEATATLVCTGNMAETQTNTKRVQTPRKNFVLVKKERGQRPRPISDTALRDYLDGLSPFQTGKDDQSQAFFDAEKGLLKKGHVVFYIEEGGQIIRFGHTPNFRVAHLIMEDDDQRATTPQDKVPPQSRDLHLIDYADAMFGYVSGDGETPRQPTAYAGRIAITSATPIDDAYRLHQEAITPRILGSPKPTTFQHYLEQPPRATDQKGALYHYGHHQAVVRGHKLYWRQKIDSVDDVKADADDIKGKEKVTTSMKPLLEGEFTFKVQFDNLTSAELGALAWALSLGGEDDAYHMLGMGKPHGMGVVKLTPELTLIDRETRYASLFDDDGKWVSGEQRADLQDYIDAFKQTVADKTGTTFDEHWRIKQLKAMLRLYQPDPELFSYMTIKPNEYTDRPVLPYPDEIEAVYDEKENERQQQERKRQQKREIQQRTTLEVGDEIRGEVNIILSSGVVWFIPQDVIIGGKWVDISAVVKDSKFKGEIHEMQKNRDKGDTVKARIIEIKKSKTVRLICEQVL